MTEVKLGVGSRVKHPQFGKGVIIKIRSDVYEISFIDIGIRLINHRVAPACQEDLINVFSGLFVSGSRKKSGRR